MSRKSLKEISWDVTEDVYRKDPALSYSILARFERGGFKSLPTLFDKIETPSLTFGSAVDTLVTGGEEEFNNKFVVADFPVLPESYTNLIKLIFDTYGKEYNSIEEIPDKDVLVLVETAKFQRNWKPETRVKVIKEKGGEYYKLLFISQDKTLIDSNLHSQVLKCVEALKTAPSTKFWLQSDDFFNEDIERLYQLKFKAVFNDIPYRCMLDLIVVDYKNKTIQPIDLKTSWSPEYEFYHSYMKWGYHIQSRLYWRILNFITREDAYFKNFSVLPFKFIVVCKEAPNPLVWDCPFSQYYQTLYVGRDFKTLLKDPEDTGQELYHYLTLKPTVPIGIDMINGNNLETWLNLNYE